VFGGVVLPLTVKLQALQAADEARADNAFWLEGCDGFAVYDDDGRVGTVARTRLGTSRPAEATSSLSVRTGLFHHRLVLIAATAVERVHRDRGRIILKARRSEPDTSLTPGGIVAPRRGAALT
jgi:hypothetical protein